MNQQATVAAIKHSLTREMKDAMPLLAFLDHLDTKAIESITWEISEKESVLSISIYPANNSSLPVYFFYRNMDSTKMRKYAYLQLKYGNFDIIGEEGQQTIFRDEAGEVGAQILAMLAAKGIQKDYYLEEALHKQELLLEYSMNGSLKRDTFTTTLKRKPLFRPYQRVEEKLVMPLVTRV